MMTDYYLYFMQQGESGPVKIGITNNVQKRIYTIQCGNPQKVNLLFSIMYSSEHAAREDEKYLHWLFSHLNLSGEWFEAKPFLLERLEIVKKEGVLGIPEAQTTYEDLLTHYEVFSLISTALNEIHHSISSIHDQIRKIGKVQSQYKQHGDYQSCKYIMLELQDTMADLNWQFRGDEHTPKKKNG